MASPAATATAVARADAGGANAMQANSPATRSARSITAASRVRRGSSAMRRRSRAIQGSTSEGGAGRRARRAGIAASTRPASTSSASAAAKLTASAPVPAEQDLQHELAAEVGDREHGESGDRVARRHASAPAEAPASEQEAGEDRPGGEREHRLVDEVLRKQVGDEQESREDRDRERRRADADHREQRTLEALEGRQRREPAAGAAAAARGRLEP